MADFRLAFLVVLFHALIRLVPRKIQIELCVTAVSAGRFSDGLSTETCCVRALMQEDALC